MDKRGRLLKGSDETSGRHLGIPEMDILCKGAVLPSGHDGHGCCARGCEGRMQPGPLFELRATDDPVSLAGHSTYSVSPLG